MAQSAPDIFYDGNWSIAENKKSDPDGPSAAEDDVTGTNFYVF